ncbi:hypothetical protein [Flavobacterium ajazii]|uniref:hypothetical protein n=1 Tax=Flavobacterium ajazii TaxID=2692318 RepID=UPI0013D63E46|nr:hypothetical protein [Flavobacterium ajazii]
MANSLEGKKQSWDGMFYSIQRIDLLIISICGAGIYVCLETIKYIATTHNLCAETLYIKVSAGSFLGGIILNFVSQQYGYKANLQSYLMYDCEIEIEEKKALSETEDLIVALEKLTDCRDDYDRKSEKFSNLTTRYNNISMFLMFVGLICTFIFFLITF